MFLLAMTTSAIVGIVVGVVAAIIVIGLIFGLLPIKIWFRAAVSGVRISMARLIGMKWRGIKVSPLVDAYISACKAGLDITIDELEDVSEAAACGTAAVCSPVGEIDDLDTGKNT